MSERRETPEEIASRIRERADALAEVHPQVSIWQVCKLFWYTLCGRKIKGWDAFPPYHIYLAD